MRKLRRPHLLFLPLLAALLLAIQPAYRPADRGAARDDAMLARAITAIRGMTAGQEALAPQLDHLLTNMYRAAGLSRPICKPGHPPLGPQQPAGHGLLALLTLWVFTPFFLVRKIGSLTVSRRHIGLSSPPIPPPRLALCNR